MNKSLVSETPLDSVPTPRTRPGGLRGLIGRRRRFLVDPREQLRASAMVMGAALMLVVLLNLSLHSARTQNAASVLAMSPELTETVETKNSIELVLVLAASVVFLAAVFVTAILQTHKTAGAALGVIRQMGLIECGVYSKPLVLRKGDNLVNVGNALNRMAEALRDRTVQEIDELERLIEMTDGIAPPVEALHLAERLRTIADQKRDLIAMNS